MRTHGKLASLLLSLALVATAAIAPALAGTSQTSFNGSQITVSSDKSFDEVQNAVKSLVAKNGMMVLGEVDQGKILSMTGLKVNAHLFLVGNPTVGKKLFSEEQALGLYVPFRVFVYTDGDNKTHISYDKPSSLLSQYENDKVLMVAHKLDEKLNGLATMAAK